MPSRIPLTTPALILALLGALHPRGAAAQAPPAIEDRTRGMQRLDGFLPLYWDSLGGKLFLEVPTLDRELLYYVSLPTGLGSNDIGLDRSQLGAERIVYFHRVGPRVLLVQPNYDFRATSDNQDERRAVEESFAQSVLWGFTVEAATAGRVLVDATTFALRDAHGVLRALKAANQGRYELDATRSAVYLPHTRAFPRNSEIEVTLTFTGDTPGEWVRDVTPTAEAITVRERHSFVALPDSGYAPRPNDPSSGYFGVTWQDFAAPLGAPITQRYLARHRLRKKDPAAAVSEAVAPIIYYVDRGIPEPLRSAVLEGARWWSQAFEAAGYRNAFRVELLPDSADPMDARYNVIQWVHRATRGWSYGDALLDPRTGEIIKGHVLLGSLRTQQDYLIAEGLQNPYPAGTERAAAAEALALARLRQLAAHEVGHTLGLMHNYIASAQGRSSVMDYPAPLVRLAGDGSFDFSAAYAAGIAEWDKLAIAYGYEDFPPGTDVPAALRRMLAEGRKRGLTFLTDEDARPTGSAHPQAHLWDNGSNAAAELTRQMALRRSALDRFGVSAIRQGMPLATLEEALVPLYLGHRYQAEAAAKVVGGVYYTYALRGDGQEPLRPATAAEQGRALSALLATLDPTALALPRSLLALIPPRPVGWPAHRELFGRTTGLTFDALSPAITSAGLTIELLLDPARAARLVEQHALQPALPGLGAVIDRLVRATFDRQGADEYQAEINRSVQRLVAEQLQALAARATLPQVRAIAVLKLAALERRAELGRMKGDEAQRAHYTLLAQELGRFRERAYGAAALPAGLTPPPGSPIGEE